MADIFSRLAGGASGFSMGAGNMMEQRRRERELKLREKEAEETGKYRQTQEERLKAQSESRIQSEKARQAYWQSRAGQTGTTKDLTPAQKAQLFTAIGGLVNGGALTEGQANVALSEYGMKWPQEPPEVPASTSGALSSLPPAISQSMPSPRLPTQPGDIWAQAPMRTTGFGGSAFSQLATPLATGQSLTGEQVPPEYKRLGVTQYRAPSGGPPQITTDEEYDALPSGTVYIDPNGKKRTKR